MMVRSDIEFENRIERKRGGVNEIHTYIIVANGIDPGVAISQLNFRGIKV